MTYEVEFGVPTAQFAYVHLKITNETVSGLLDDMDSLSDAMAVRFGQTHAALTGAVNHGHANPAEAAEPAVNPEELIKSELGGKVLETRQKPTMASLATVDSQSGETVQVAVNDPSEAPSRPWNKPSQPAQQKPWQVEPHVRDTIPSEDIDDFFS